MPTVAQVEGSSLGPAPSLTLTPGQEQAALQATVQALPGASEYLGIRDGHRYGMQIAPALREGRYADAAAAAVMSVVVPVLSVTGVHLPALKGLSLAFAGTFAGERALTADLGALERARAMEKAGADPRAIWKDAGWFKGPDGHWRFEIDDRAAKYRTPLPWQGPKKTMGEALPHPELYKAYPDLAGVEHKVVVDPAFSGKHVPAWGGTTEAIEMSVPRGTDKTRVAVHEMQHAVQDREGFEPGGYNQRWLGEIEARAVEARRAMTPEQRRATFPLDSYDVPPGQAILSGQAMPSSVDQAKAAMSGLVPVTHPPFKPIVAPPAAGPHEPILDAMDAIMARRR